MACGRFAGICCAGSFPQRWGGFSIRLTFAGLILLTTALASAAQVTLNGWEVGKKDGTCIAYHAFKDRNDDNAANVISLGLVKAPDGAQAMVMSLFYEKWNINGDEEADLLFESTASWPVPSGRSMTRIRWSEHSAAPRR